MSRSLSTLELTFCATKRSAIYSSADEEKCSVLILPCARKSQRCSTTGSKNKHAFLSIWCQGMYQTLDFIIPPFAAGLIGRKGVWKQQGKKCNDSAWISRRLRRNNYLLKCKSSGNGNGTNFGGLLLESQEFEDMPVVQMTKPMRSYHSLIGSDSEITKTYWCMVTLNIML